jgi:transglutaminase-like putative cysteine protease
MRIRIGYQIDYAFPAPTPMIALLNVHHSRVGALDRPDWMTTTPGVPVEPYRDAFGNWCCRLVAPAGAFRLSADTTIVDSGAADEVDPAAFQHPVEQLPSETLLYLLPSRYCDSDALSEEAWRLFEKAPVGWGRVQAICDFVHKHIRFGYEHARVTRTASEGYRERVGVCRDFTHLAVAFCRAMNIPTRYCTGYLCDIRVPDTHAPGDFAAWMECYLGGRWHIFDPRNNTPRIGRVLIATGRDAADVPLIHTFGANLMTGFKVWTDEVSGGGAGL